VNSRKLSEIGMPLNLRTKLNNQNNMEKQIKMSLETAQKLWKRCAQELSGALVKEFLLENFTQEELEGKKGFDWMDSFNRGGYYITGSSLIANDGNLNTNSTHKNIFKTREQAESALAFAQLTHIVDKYNESVTGQVEYLENEPISSYIQGYTDGALGVSAIKYTSMILPKQPLLFIQSKDAHTSLEVNLELWEKYWMLKK
jgi:hypothetical protein